jgi:hypothetical protein
LANQIDNPLKMIISRITGTIIAAGDNVDVGVVEFVWLASIVRVVLKVEIIPEFGNDLS